MRTSLAKGCIWAVFLGVVGCGARSLDSGEERKGITRSSADDEALGGRDQGSETATSNEGTEDSNPEPTLTGEGTTSAGAGSGVGGMAAGGGAGVETQPAECIPANPTVNDEQRLQRMATLFWADGNADTTDYAAPDRDGAEVAREMLKDPRAEAGVTRFIRHWFGLGDELRLALDETREPELWQATESMLQSTDETIMQLFRQDSPLRSFFTSNHAMLNSQLGEYYGVAVPESGFEWVALPEERSAGLLTQAHWLAASSNLVRRGTTLRHNLLCSPVPPPPPELVTSIVDPEDGLTGRERFAAHQSQPACAGCHSHIDPLGYAFENFDAVGRYRTTEVGKPIDASGKLVDLGIEFSDYRELVALFDGALHEQISSCAVRTALDYASSDADRFGLGSSLSEACVSRYAIELETAAAQSTREWLIALATHPVFDDDLEH